MKISLRKMVKEDLEFVNKIRNQKSTRSMLENSDLISYDDTVTWFENFKPEWFIIEVKDKKVGYMRTSDDTGSSICIGCDIHKENRRKGYAYTAYTNMIEKLYLNGYSVIWLKVFNKNIPAIKLYEKLGFIEIGSEIKRDLKYSTMVHVRPEK